MILQMIALSGWRCFLEEVAVGPFSEGLNVISGPNGIGKSTLFEAFRRALMDSHSVTGQDVTALRPWGRALSPKVTVWFAHGGVQYRMIKQFLEGAFARLERKENGAFRSLAEGRQADEHARDLISKNPPGRGFSQPRNWGLAQVLWAPQGEMRLNELSGDLVSDIRAALGVQVFGRSSGPVEEKIAECYDRFYTPQGKVKSGKAAPPVVHLRESLEQALQRRRDNLETLQRFEEASKRVEELQALYRQLTIEADELAKSVQDARQRSDEYRNLKSQVETRQSELEKAEAQHKQIKQQIDMIRSTEKEQQEKKNELIGLEADVPLKRQELEIREKEAAEAKKSLDAARKEENVVAGVEKDADTARQYADSKEQLAQLSQRIRKIEAVDRALTAHKKARAALVAPDRRTLKGVRKAIQEKDEARLLMDAAMITLEIVPGKKGVMEVITGEETGQVKLSAGKSAIIKGAPEIVVELKGVARLRASGPAGDIQTHRQTIQEKERKIGELTRPYDTEDISRLEELAEKAETLDRQVGEALKELETLLGEDELEELKREEARLEAILTGIEKEYPVWRKSPPDKEELKRLAADLKWEYIRKVKDTEAVWDGAQQALSAVREQEQVLIARLEDIRKNIRKIEAEYAELTQDEKTLQQRETELNRILLEWDAGKAALKELKEKLKEFGYNPEAVLKKLEGSMEATQGAAQKSRDEERKAMGNLEVLAAKGSYSALAQAEEEVAQFQEEIRREELRMEAIRLLYDTVNQCRSEAISSVARPVEEAATRMLHRIAGRRIGRIKIGETFEPSGVSPEMVDSPVELVNLSGGEQEQLYLATRLALAEVLAKDERQLVVLDDVLTATDSGRLARVMTLLEEAAERLQIIILTCHPERYRVLADAQFFDLESLLKS
jgi:DNA repair exonuclease SbcCD ATPase subunit